MVPTSIKPSARGYRLKRVRDVPDRPGSHGHELRDYTITPTNGVMTVTTAGTTTSLLLSNTNLTFTATITSATAVSQPAPLASTRVNLCSAPEL